MMKLNIRGPSKLGVKLTGLFLMLSLLPLFGVGYLAYRNGQQSIQAQQFDHLETVVALKANELNRWVQFNVEQLSALAQRPLVQEHAAALAQSEPGTGGFQDAADELLTNHLRPALRDDGGFWQLLLLSADDGLVLASTREDNTGESLANQPYFMEGRHRSYVQNVYYAASLGQPAMSIAAPVVTDNGEVVAVLAGHLNLAEMAEITRQASELTASQDTYLVNSANLFVTDPRFGRGYVLTEAVRTPGVEQCLQRQSGHGLYDDYRATPVLGAYRWVPEREWCVLTEIDRAEALGPIDALRGSVLGAGLLASLGVVLAGAFFARSITKPVRQLARGAERIGRGDLEYEIDVKARDEIGQLAQAFNQMAANLRDSLGETAHGKRLLLALSDAAQAVQQARTPQEVYRTVGAEVADLGFNASVLLLTEDQKAVRVGYLGFDSSLLAMAEKLTGLNADTHHFPLPPGSYYDRVIRREETLFIEPVHDFIAEALPGPVRVMAGRVAALLGMEEAIIAPLAVEGEVLGALTVTGSGLSRPDVTAVNAFANQTAIALKNARLYEELRRYRDHLAELVEERTAELRQSESRFRALFQAAPIPLLVTDIEEGLILKANEHVAEMLRLSPEDVTGSNVADLYHDATERDTRVQSILQQGHVRSHELTVRRGDSTLAYLLLSTAVIDYEGQQGLLTGFLDVTERKQMEDALRQSEERFRALVHNASDIITIIDGEGCVQYDSPSIEGILGYGPDERLGLSVFEYAHPDDVPAVTEAFQGALAERQELVNLEVRVRHRDGSWRILEVTVGNLLHDPAVKGIVVNSHDVTKRKRAEEKLARYAEELALSNEELQQFAYVASHDLQEPLRMVSSFLQLLQQRYGEQLDERADEYIYFAVDGATRMKRLINDLLQYSRVTTRGQPPAPVSSHKVLVEVLEDLQIAIEESGATVGHDTLPMIMADETQARQLFQNLIGNAIKFRNDAPPRIHVGVEWADGMWQFAVQDNGIGIERRHGERIFAVFQRLHGRDYEGTGIGLAICKKIVERHGGTIWVESEPEKGSTFYFTLPPVGERTHEYQRQTD